jgi:hypothetical protein
MEWIQILGVAALLAVLLIHYNLWRLLDEQKRHNRATENPLAEIRDRLAPSGRTWPPDRRLAITNGAGRAVVQSCSRDTRGMSCGKWRVRSLC